MNRREFLAAVLAAAAGAKIAELCNSEIPDRDAFTCTMDFGYGDSWSGVMCVDRQSGLVLSEKLLNQARDRIWASHGRPTVYDRRIYDRTGMLVPL